MAFVTRIPLIALAAALPAVAQAQSVNDFTLEPAPTPSATPQVQGPADTRSGVEIRPRAVATPTQAPTASPTAAPSPAPTLSPVPGPSGDRAPRAPVTQPSPRATPLPAVTPRTLDPGEAAAMSSAPDELPSVEDPASDTRAASSVAEPAVPAAPLPDPAANEEGGRTPWLPLAGGAMLLALLGAGFAAWRRRRRRHVPEIQRPVVRSAPPAGPAALGDALRLHVESDKIIRSAAFVTLKYRLTLTNRSETPLGAIGVGLDLVSAHAQAPMDQQVATAETVLEERHAVPRLAPGQSITLDGQVQLALAQAQVIRQGRHPLLVPLLRMRISARGGDALLRTFVVGQTAPGSSRVQPIRLDEGPRSYSPVAQRELA